jgi:hypothetical protein
VGGSFTNAGGLSSGYLARWGFAVPVTILEPPTDVQVAQGSPASFTVGTAGTIPLVFQWRHNGKNLVDGGNISGAFTTTLHLHSTHFTDAGAYDVVISNTCGEQTSRAAELTVTSCVGDIAGAGGLDGVVGVPDLLAIINSWGPCPPPCAADLAPAGSPDGTVGTADLLALINAWGPCP